MNIDELIAIDIHTHAEVSCWNPWDAYGEEYDRAADKYFGSSNRPTISETVTYYREHKIGLVMFTVDSESNMGRRRIPNEEAGFKPEVKPPILKENAVRLLGLDKKQ